MTTSKNDVKKIRPNFDWKVDLMLDSTNSILVDPEVNDSKPSENNLSQRGCWIVHDIKEDDALKELMDKVCDLSCFLIDYWSHHFVYVFILCCRLENICGVSQEMFFQLLETFLDSVCHSCLPKQQMQQTELTLKTGTLGLSIGMLHSS